ncbi:MAG: hypothetical protein ACRC5F_06210 [Cetobacterium sp.]
MLKKLFLVAALTALMMGCSSTSKKEALKAETSVAPKNVAVLLADRGTLNDVNGVKLFRENLVKETSGANAVIKVQDGTETVKLLEEKQGITVAGQLAGVEKAELRKDLKVDGLVYVQVTDIDTDLKPSMENFKPAGVLTKKLEANVKVYSQGLLYKDIPVLETEEIKVTLEELNNLKETIVEVNNLVKNINSTNIKNVDKMPEYIKLKNRLNTYDAVQKDKQLAVIFDTLPTEQLYTLFMEMFKKSGVIKGHPYENLIQKAAKKVQFN